MFRLRAGAWRAAACLGLLLGSAGAASAEAIPSSSELFARLSGYVYSDTTGNAIFDPFEVGIAGVEIVLSGFDLDGGAVLRSVTTDSAGYYLFEELLPGTYALAEVQPERYVQGKPNAVGAAGGVAVDSDHFAGITLLADLEAGNYNFGEWGLKAEYITKKPFLVTIPEPSTLALLVAGAIGILACRRRLRCCSTAM